MNIQTYIARWYVNGRPDIALVAEETVDLARAVAQRQIALHFPDAERRSNGEIRVMLTPWNPAHESFHLLSYGGYV